MYTKWVLLFGLLILYTGARPVEADGEVKLTLGTSAFIDEDIPLDHFVLGASYGIQLTKRLWIEPQFLAMFGPGNDRDLILTGNIAYDLLDKEKFELYVIACGGLLHHRDQFGSGPAFSGTEPLFNGGIGAKIHVSERIFIAPEFRIGFEPLFLGIVSIGYRF